MPAKAGSTLTRNLHLFLLGKRLGRFHDRLERGRNDLQIASAGFAEFDAAPGPPKQRHAEAGFQCAHMAADRRVVDAQLRGGAGKALMPGGRLEGAQGIERRQSTRHSIRDFPSRRT